MGCLSGIKSNDASPGTKPRSYFYIFAPCRGEYLLILTVRFSPVFFTGVFNCYVRFLFNISTVTHPLIQIVPETSAYIYSLVVFLSCRHRPCLDLLSPDQEFSLSSLVSPFFLVSYFIWTFLSNFYTLLDALVYLSECFSIMNYENNFYTFFMRLFISMFSVARKS